jgi:uridine phosphorylase
MPFPNFQGKHLHDSFFTPQDWLNYFKREGIIDEFEMPEGMIFCYQNYLLDHILKNEEVERMPFRIAEAYSLKSTGGKVGICGRFGIGAPVAASLLEEMIVLGSQRFMSIGAAGGLQPGLEIGQIVVCNKAVRDEGVSHHYLEPDKYAWPSPELTARLKSELDQAGVTYQEGPTWTIDAPFRETVEEARHYQSEGVYTVEMEAAAMMAVAQYRKVDLATAFVISDSLAELEWNPQFRALETRQGLYKLYQIARSALL